MSQYVMFADLGEKVVITDAPEHVACISRGCEPVSHGTAP